MNNKLEFKAFDEGGMDGLLRQTMEGHRIEPKPGLWKAISRKLLWREIVRLNFTNLSARFLAAGAATLLVISAALYVSLPSSIPAVSPAVLPVPQAIPASDNNEMIPDRHLVSQSGPVSVTSSLRTDLPASAHNSGKAIQETVVSNSSDALTNSLPPSNSTQQRSINGMIENSMNASSSIENSLPENLIPAMGGSHGISPPASQEDITWLLPIESPLLWIPPADDSIITINTPGGMFKYKKESPAAVQFFSTSLGAEPEMAFYSEPDIYSKANFWINGRLTYHISRFSIATGLGLGYVFDEGKYRIDYQSSDSVGYFNNVISYTTGTNNEIIFTTETRNVYDSLLHMADDRTRNRYAYLQVPFLLGYRLFESNSVSFTFQAGPAVSFLIGTHESPPVINYPNARIIKVEDETPSRITTNWQIWANLNLEVRLTRKISFYLEPSFKYFLKPLVEQENVRMKAPLSIGLGIALQFNFGKK
jgi:hypothetical protein